MVSQTNTLIVDIQLPPLHTGRDGKGQVEIFDSTARFKVVVCGRRWGKTTLGTFMCLHTALKGGRTWWVAPTYKLATEGWSKLKPLAFALKDAGLNVDIREGDFMVRFPDLGPECGVEVRSSDTEGSLRGSGLDGVAFDEFAQARESAWTEELRPALIDHRGWALFIGTPRGHNWAERLHKRGGKVDGWASWRKWSGDNPLLSAEELEGVKLELPEAVHGQEIMADFGSSQLQVYPDFDRELHKWKGPLPKFEHFYCGLDFGGTTIGSHKSAGLIAGYNNQLDALILLREFEESGSNVAERQLQWMGEQEASLKMYQRSLGHRAAGFTWTADKTQMAFIQIVRGTGFHIRPSVGGKASVMNGIALVQRRLKFRENKARLYYIDGLTKFPDAIERYRFPEFREGENKTQSQNPLKVNDDTSDAFRYLVGGIDQRVTGDPQKLYRNVLGGIRG